MKRTDLGRHALAIIILGMIVALMSMSCTSKSERRRDAEELLALGSIEQPVALKVPITSVRIYGNVTKKIKTLSFWNKDNSITQVKGTMSQVQDTIFVHQITYIYKH